VREQGEHTGITAAITDAYIQAMLLVRMLSVLGRTSDKHDLISILAAVKANDLQTAIKHYYTVILNLKGISSSNSGLETMFNAARITSPTQPRFSEVTEEDEVNDTNDEKNGHAEEQEPERGPTPPPEDETYTETNIKKVLSSSYVNMAICFAKKEEWSKCRRNAEGSVNLLQAVSGKAMY